MNDSVVSGLILNQLGKITDPENRMRNSLITLSSLSSNSFLDIFVKTERQFGSTVRQNVTKLLQTNFCVEKEDMLMELYFVCGSRVVRKAAVCSQICFAEEN
jgi:hypothetical protein